MLFSYQSVLFLLAGFETTGTSLTNVIFMLTKHPKVQANLYAAIYEKLHKFVILLKLVLYHDDTKFLIQEDVNHEMILDFPFLDHIIKETLRIMPPVLR